MWIFNQLFPIKSFLFPFSLCFFNKTVVSNSKSYALSSLSISHIPSIYFILAYRIKIRAIPGDSSYFYSAYLLGVKIISEYTRNILASFNTFSSFNYKDKQFFISSLKELSTQKNIVFACIGSDRATGDSLGPLVGTDLKRLGYTVFGTLEEPLHAQNLAQELHEIRAVHNPDLILAIDASLGRLEDIGMISLADSPLKPGAGVQKDLPPVGDLSILANVNIGGFWNLQILQCTRLHTVMKLATDITHLIWQAIPLPHKSP